MLTLPPECRGLFKKPFGLLYPEFSDVVSKLDGRCFCTVGDVVTQNAFLHNLRPDVSVIDGVTKRCRCVSKPALPDHVLRVTNPAGTITDELVDTLRQAVEMRPSVVMVDGEEDLAVLPLVEILPDSAVILYGQPDEGVVFCEVNDALRQNARKLLDCFAGL